MSLRVHGSITGIWYTKNVMVSLSSFWPWRHSRDTEDTAQDVLLLLYMLSKSDSTGRNKLEAQLRIMKYTFLAEYQMSVKRAYKGLNFFFNIFKRGPSSTELLNLLDLLVEKKLVSFDETNSAFSLTPGGKSTIEEFISSVTDNKDFFTIIDDVIKDYGSLPLDTLLDKVYAMNVTPMHSTETINIGESVKNSPKKRLLMRMEKSEAKKELQVPEDWVNTVDILLNTKVYA